MAQLLLGPLLRYVSDTEATIWVETDAPCEVDVLGRTTGTFTIAGHHYALVILDGLDPGSTLPYEVRLDGDARLAAARRRLSPVRRPHPQPRRQRCGSPSARAASRSRTASRTRSRKDDDPRGREVDALLALVQRMRDAAHRRSGPTPFCMLGDQVYADEVSPDDRALHRVAPPRSRRPAGRRGRRLRGVHGAVPRELERPCPALAAVDRLQRDDLRRPRRPRRLEHLRHVDRPDAREAVVGGAHPRRVHVLLDLPAPRQPLARPALRRPDLLRGAGGRRRLRAARARLRPPQRATRSPARAGASRRDFGRTRLVMLDSRAGRVLTEGRAPDAVRRASGSGPRTAASGDFDHLVIGTSLPVMLGPGMHHLEAWNEAVCDGAWGSSPRAPARSSARPSTSSTGPPSRAASAASRCCSRTSRPGAADRPRRRSSCSPATCTTPTSPRRGSPAASVTSRVLQATCSPIRNPLDKRERRLLRSAFTRPVAALARRMARAAGVTAGADALGLRAGSDVRQPDRPPRPARPRGVAADREDPARGLAGAAPAPDDPPQIAPKATAPRQA